MSGWLRCDGKEDWERKRMEEKEGDEWKDQEGRERRLGRERGRDEREGREEEEEGCKGRTE